jgi:hypothetical protein
MFDNFGETFLLSRQPEHEESRYDIVVTVLLMCQFRQRSIVAEKRRHSLSPIKTHLIVADLCEPPLQTMAHRAMKRLANLCWACCRRNENFTVFQYLSSYYKIPVS